MPKIYTKDELRQDVENLLTRINGNIDAAIIVFSEDVADGRQLHGVTIGENILLRGLSEKVVDKVKADD